jgi:hypothetical protein
MAKLILGMAMAANIPINITTRSISTREKLKGSGTYIDNWYIKGASASRLPFVLINN